jgi:hypothetical protein
LNSPAFGSAISAGKAALGKSAFYEIDLVETESIDPQTWPHERNSSSDLSGATW